MNTKVDDKLIILFDGFCNLCIASVQFIINRDSKDIFRFVPIQSDIGKEIILNKEIDCLKNNSIILIKENSVNYRSSAVLHILYYLNTMWKFLIVFYIIPYPIRDFIYNLISKKRYFLFGKKNKCMVPDKNINSKFLSL